MIAFGQRALVGLAYFLFAVAVAASFEAPDGAFSAIHPETIRADMAFLADDLLEGREPGSPGYRVAAAYVAARFSGLGLRPGAADGTYFQQVPLRSVRVEPQRSTFSVRSGQEEYPLVLGQDVILDADPGRSDVDVEAQLVFVGYGISAPDKHYDDYAHMNVRGKIVVALYGAPETFEPAVRAHYSEQTVKHSIAAAHGAIGFLNLYSEDFESRFPFEKMARSVDSASYAWLDPAGMPNDYLPQIKASGFVAIPAAKNLLLGTSRSAKSIYALAKAGRLKPFPLAAHVVIHTATISSDLRSPNVVAVLEGSDAALKQEYLVYSAHLDHVGVGPAVNGDAIYNGALDNASGVAAVLSIAEAFSHATERPRRSILFVAVTGEESGLLGSDFFAHYPPVPVTSLVADLNFDGGVPLWPIADICPYGAEHSTLLETLRGAAAEVHLNVSPDPHPEEVMFIRSDQYSFVRQGIPAAFVSEGIVSSDPTVDVNKRLAEWWATTYHEPSDDMNQPNLNFDSAAVLVKLSFLAGWSIANESRRPQWINGDFFGRTFRKPAQRTP